MAFLDKLTDFAKDAGDRASDALEMTKLKTKISSEKKEINGELAKIGKVILDRVKAGEMEMDEDLAHIIERIDAHNQTIEELQSSLEALARE